MIFSIYKRTFLVCLVVVLVPLQKLKSQEFIDNATVQGNIYSEANYYFTDTLIGAPEVPEYIRANIYGNVFYRYKGFNAGVRFEAYQPPLVGFDTRYEGLGIAHRFASYSDDSYEVTIGNFYEQYGSGLILRAYEDKNLGIDNAFDGFRLLVRPANGLVVKGMIGKQRFFWDVGPGTVRGFDAEWSLLQTLLPESSTNLTIGASAVSRYQSDKDPLFNFPENVAAFASRTSLYTGNYFFSAEYAWKVNDPSATNNNIYKNGQAVILSGSYSKKGIGVLLSAKYVDNMDFRSSRTATGNDLSISYIPAISYQHTYSLAAKYPYATQPLGEVGAKAQVSYFIGRGTKVGGKYGTNIVFNASIANSIQKEKLHDTLEIGTQGTKGYSAKFGSIGDEKYYHDLSVEINRKISKSVKIVAGAANQFYNKAIIEGHPDEEPVKAWVVYGDVSYRFLQNQNVRFELQHLSTKQDKGNWAMALVEYTFAPQWSFAVSDQYNYGNSDAKLRKHFYSFNVAVSKESNRISFFYGKQSDGVICVGGVCRKVPAAYAAGISYSKTF
ncbi:MAG TPA: DUF6029 family protein [Tenuifilaceae bacterium]|nr:DUF6029 family protein [Tenuifilaceae bacterium]HPE18068.1 DUF6029 family protein [Tenuifilaceae bacterium]HPJ45438.1 DUF6029 family protein [Tenuifilaceae bacterium]HPQ34055.1 DUF6029 family protein [Tenuifilaceae bacterium]HRX69247.1 DUF6029 family protein [Tenuifilaceae bacterium]